MCYKEDVPKVVDPDTRRRDVVDAAFQVIHRDGLEHASLRAIADQAGLAVGSVRHYFATHDEIMTFAMQSLSERIGDRMMDRLAGVRAEFGTTGPGASTPAGRDLIVAMLAELLPLDEQRHFEADVWLSFVTAARNRVALRPYAAAMHDGIRAIVRRVLHAGDRRGVLAVTDVDLEVERLAAVLDGLTLAMILPPATLTARTVRDVVRVHIDGLARNEPRPVQKADDASRYEDAT